MSVFSDQLKDYITRRGVTIRQLSVQTGIEYSFLYRITTGKRNPSSADMVNLLVRALALSKHESDALREAYEIARVGESTYQRRAAVRQMLESVGQLPPPALAFQNSVRMEHLPEICTGRHQVHTLIKALLDQECSLSGGQFRIIAQPNDPFLLELLQVQTAHAPQMQVTQIVCFPNRPAEEDQTIGLFAALLPLLLNLPNYSAHYYYGAAQSISGKMALFPGLLLTSSAGVLFTADYTTALCCPAGGDHYRMLEARFQECLEHCPPLMRPVSGLPAYLDSLQHFYHDMESASREKSMILTPDFCYVPFLTSDICDRVLSHHIPDRDRFVEKVMQQVSVSHTLCALQTTWHFTTESGVRRFMATGRFLDLPPGLYSPLTLEERRMLLRSFLDAVRTIPGYHVALYDPAVLPFSPTLECTVMQNSTHALFVTPLSDTAISSVDIQEPIISGAIYDYFASLIDHPAVLSEEESLKRLYFLLDEFS